MTYQRLPGAISEIVFLPSGRQFVTLADVGRIQLWDVAD
jgi:hypothetical protein